MINQDIDSIVNLITKQGQVIDLATKTIANIAKICEDHRKRIEKLEVTLGDTEANAKLALYKIKRAEDDNK